MKTVCIQIGNSDDKLSQRQWSEFVIDVLMCIDDYVEKTHFSGGSSNWEMWQNYCWVVEVLESNMAELFAQLSAVGTKYNQDSVAVLVGDTQFI